MLDGLHGANERVLEPPGCRSHREIPAQERLPLECLDSVAHARDAFMRQITLRN
jgi:hypothetical protein